MNPLLVSSTTNDLRPSGSPSPTSPNHRNLLAGDLSSSSSTYEEDERLENTPLLLLSPPATIRGRSLVNGMLSVELEPNEDHCHGPDPERKSTKQARRQLTIASLLCFLFVIGELLGGYYSGSLAIMADAAHMFSDFASFGVSLFVIWLSGKKPRKSMTYGYYRAEALGALTTIVIIWYVTGILTYLAVDRLHTGEFEIQDTAMVAVASAAVIFNIVLGLCLHGACCTGMGHLHTHSHGGHSRLQEEGAAGDVSLNHSHSSVDTAKHINIRAALIHVLGDFLQSVGVLVSSVLIKIFGDSCKIADPICTLIFAGIVLVTTVSVLRDTIKILAEGTPKNVTYDRVYEDLKQVEGVEGVHDLHIWSLTADMPALSVHLAVTPGTDQGKVLREANKILHNKFAIRKTTVQIELFKMAELENCSKCLPLNI